MIKRAICSRLAVALLTAATGAAIVGGMSVAAAANGGSKIIVAKAWSRLRNSDTP